jgi:hypothetical protein
MTKDRKEILLTLVAQELFLARLHRNLTGPKFPKEKIFEDLRSRLWGEISELREQLGLKNGFEREGVK